MNYFIIKTILLVCLIEQIKSIFTKSTSNVKYVNPIIGTYQPPNNQGNYGAMIPTTGFPFAMTRFTPYTQENHVGICPYTYSFTESTFYGFLATHQPAQWMGESGEVAICPGGNDNGNVGFPDRGLTFSHTDEISTPYYYKSDLKNNLGNNIKAELASTSRAASMRFTFDDSFTAPFVVVQATRDSVNKTINGEINIDIEKREISGWNPERQDDVLGPFEAKDFKGYFVVQFDENFVDYGISHNNEKSQRMTSGVGGSLGAYVVFADNIHVVNCRVGVSFISIDQARINLNNEIKENQTLEDVSKVTESKWAEKLDLVEITNATDDDLAIFYTAMYHSLQYPYEMNEFDKNGVSQYYSGFDNKVHQGDNSYTGYSIWDTFRAEWAFLNLFAPERIDGMIQSMLQGYQEGGEGGRLPMWQNIVETNIMIGTHSSSLIAESLAKGFKNFDLKVTWEALYKDAMVPPDNDLTTQYYDREEGTACEARAGLTRQKELGYVAAELTSEAGSRTLEYAYDDYTVAVAAEILGYPDDAAFFHERSKSYRNIWNNETKFMESKYENGKWCPDPSTWTEATKWVYTFNVQHDFPGLRDLFQGPKQLSEKLDEYYNGGFNDQTNEPSHATVFAYLYANEPSKAQSTIRGLLTDNYFNTPRGISGNDDCGQMSAWFIFNSFGFYPMNPASAEYMVGTPKFDKITIKLPQSQEELTITSNDAYNNIYVESVQIDNNQLIIPVITHKQLLAMKSLNFNLNNEPQQWGVDTL